MKKIISKNPANKYDILGEINVSTTQEIKEKVNLANKIKNHWKELDINKKIELLKPIYLEFIKRKRELSKLISKEIGKTAYESFREVEISLNQFEWYLNNVKSSIKDEITYEDDDSIHKIVYEPFGSVVVISPWNFPFGIAINGIIPNLLVGNVVLFKIAEECPLLGKFIETIFNNHSLPKSVFLVIFGGKVEGKILLKEKIDLICFTGSTKVGEEIYKIASNKFIKAILELGGSSPGIICDSADVSFAVKTIFKSRFYNSGQICDCVKRAIVHESIFNEFVLEMKNMLASKKQGNPLEQNIDFGSLVSNKQLKLLESQVNDAIKKKAKIIIGGKKNKKLNGAFYEPTLLTNINKSMKVWKEEVFGPVLPIVSFKTEDEAIKLANDTQFGLGCKIISKNINEAKRIASKIQAGTVEINGGVRWQYLNPFGGYKKSGMGRSYGIIGFREICQIKVISINK